MLNWLKKEWRELKDNDRHQADVSEISNDPSENFNELVKLGERVNPRFKLSGNYQLFMIKGKSDNIMLIICVAIIIFFPSFLLFQNMDNLICWIIELIVIGTILLFFRYYPSSNDIIIDTWNKQIEIKSNNFIGRFIIPELIIKFDVFDGFTSKMKSIESSSVNRVYIHFKSQKKAMIDLPNGPFYVVNPRIFTENLYSLIKNSK